MTRSRGFLLNMLGKEASPTPFVVACTMLDLLVPRLVNDDSPYLDPQLLLVAESGRLARPSGAAS